jgi:putative nucleotidyltransferase with HDIG domain
MSRQDSKLVRTDALSRSLRARKRAFEQQTLGVPGLSRVLEGLAQPSQGLGLVVTLVFALSATLLAVWTRDQALVAAGRIAQQTHLVRVQELSTIDEVQTRQQRDAARQSAPQVFEADVLVLDALVQQLHTLPAAVASATSLSDVDPGMRALYGLTEASLAELRKAATDADAGRAWRESIEAVDQMLRKRPILDPLTYQRSQQGAHKVVRLVESGFPVGEAYRGEEINLEDATTLARAMQIIARDAGLVEPLRGVVVRRLTAIDKPTYAFDQAATAAVQEGAVDAVRPVHLRFPRHDVLARQGEQLTAGQQHLIESEWRAYAEQTPWPARWAGHASVGAACAGISAALAGYSIMFAPRLRRRVSRIVGTAVLLLGMLAAATLGTAAWPQGVGATATLPTVFVAVLMCIGYDRRTALAMGLLHALLACLALREGLATLAIIMTGVGCVVGTLREVRDRKSLVRTSVAAGLGLAMATIVFRLLERPLDMTMLEPTLRELLGDAALAGAGMLVVGGLTLFVLPAIERAFNVTTGMTLTELRDPKQPLLRELQLRAPGTYTHSLNVASIAETAAEAVGADSLLTYVGALYHDVGKMNKPEYFIENQTGGPNKHDRLSPAMSLLIVVGHVKDGMELAREFRLPVRLQHFVEAHHGTTLVEYFFHRAKQRAIAQAGAGGEDDEGTLLPDEFEYRYPGPKPRTKEVAIVMVSDACESACRALGEPTPARIEALVRDIAGKRLRDGQFDDCELTLKELSAISQSVARTLTSMYHARVSYPGPKAPERVEAPPEGVEPKTRGGISAAAG